MLITSSVSIKYNHKTNKFDYIATHHFNDEKTSDVPLTSFEQLLINHRHDPDYKGALSSTGSADYLEHINRNYKPTDTVIVEKGNDRIADGYTINPETRVKTKYGYSGLAVYNSKDELLGIVIADYKSGDDVDVVLVDDPKRMGEYEIPLSHLIHHLTTALPNNKGEHLVAK